MMKTEPAIPFAGYIRRSTADRQEASLDSQKKAIQDHAESTGSKIIKWYVDDGKSGTKAKGRPGFLSLIQDVEVGDCEFQGILVYDFDRWGRFIDPEEGTYYRQHCKRHGAPVIFVIDFDMVNQDNVGSRVIRTVKQEVATEESRKRSALVFERSKSNAERGFSNGGRPPFGYERWAIDQNGKERRLLPGHHCEKLERVFIKPGPTEHVALIERIFKMRGVDGLGYGEIANTLNVEHIPSPSGGQWGKPYIGHILKNRCYIGQLTYGKFKKGKFRSDRIEAVPETEWAINTDQDRVIIDAELWAKVRALDEVRKRHFDNKSMGRCLSSQYFLLSGLIVCNECGRNFQGKPRKGGNGKRYFYYTDGGAVNSGKSVCTPYHIQRDFLESEILTFIQQSYLRGLNAQGLTRKIERLLSKSAGVDGRRLTGIDRRRKAISQELQNVVEAVAKGADFGMFHDKIQALQSEDRRLTEEVKSIQSRTCDGHKAHEETVKIVAQIQNLGQLLLTGGIRKKREIVRQFIDRIEVFKNDHTAKVYAWPIPILDERKSLLSLNHVGHSVNAGGGNRTHTRFRSHRILSPARLPVPPLRRPHNLTGSQFKYKIEGGVNHFREIWTAARRLRDYLKTRRHSGQSARALRGGFSRQPEEKNRPARRR